MDYRFSLRDGSKHDRCPGCGQMTFKPYVDKKTGLEVGGKYGRCERINTCGYLLYPKTEKDDNWMPEKREYTPPPPTDYVAKFIVEKTFIDFFDNTFIGYLMQLFGRKKAMELQRMYNIGTAKNNGTIFWQKDDLDRFRTGKVFYYNENGKRDKSKNSWFVHTKVKRNFQLKQCFFGLHLVDLSKPVALCESEKTAVIMSVFEPEFVWVASGGSEMLNVERLADLPRLDKVFADNGQFEKWAKKTQIFDGRKMDTTVDRAVEDGVLPAGADVLDLYLLTLKMKL